MFSDSPHLFKNIRNKLFNNKELKVCRFTLYFPCFQHSEEVIAFTIKYYINMRMRQFSQSYNSEAQRENMNKKKIAKFTLT